MRACPAVLLPVLFAACSGDPDGTGTAGTTGTAGATTTADTSADATGGSTGAPTTTQTTTPTTTETGDPTTDPTTDGLTTSSTTQTTSDPGTTSAETTASTGTDTDANTDTGTDTTDTTDTTGTTGAVGECTPGDIQPCYSGPADTQDVGQCAAGEQLCTPQSEWAPCIGEVLPAPESCVTPGDESCDGIDPCGGTGTYQWDRVFGGAGKENGLRVGFDGAGNVVLAGNATGNADLGGGNLASAGGSDILLAKYAPDGAHLWSKRFGDAANQFTDGFALHVDAAGEVVLGGDFEGKVDFGGGPLTAQSSGDLFLVKFSPTGAHVWSKAFKAGGYAIPGAVTRDKTGNILFGGYFLTSLELGGGVMTSAGLVDAFVGKFDPDGKHVWSQRFGDPQGQYVLGLATDLAGNVYMSGGFQGTINPGNGQLISAGDADVFLARLDSKGTAEWGKRFGDSKLQVSRDLSIDATGKLVISGEMQGTVDFGGGPIAAPSTRSFIAQYDSSGAHQWSKLIGDGSAQTYAVAHDGLGQVLVTGSFSGASDFGGGTLTSEGSNDIFALKLDGAGKHVWSKRFGDFMGQTGFDIAGSSTGSVAITGQFQGGVNFGGGPATSKGDFDGFLAVFGP